MKETKDTTKDTKPKFEYLEQFNQELGLDLKKGSQVRTNDIMICIGSKQSLKLHFKHDDDRAKAFESVGEMRATKQFDIVIIPAGKVADSIPIINNAINVTSEPK